MTGGPTAFPARIRLQILCAGVRCFFQLDRGAPTAGGILAKLPQGRASPDFRLFSSGPWRQAADGVFFWKNTPWLKKTRPPQDSAAGFGPEIQFPHLSLAFSLILSGVPQNEVSFGKTVTAM